MVAQHQIVLPEFRRGFHLVTSHIERNLLTLPKTGIVNLFIQHTSAALTINENADPSVRADFRTFTDKIISDGDRCFSHTLEGDDDMPAHIKSSVYGQSLTIPVTNGRLNLGTWQGIYLCEFRDYGGPRHIVITVIGE